MAHNKFQFEKIEIWKKLSIWNSKFNENIKLLWFNKTRKSKNKYTDCKCLLKRNITEKQKLNENTNWFDYYQNSNM